MVDWRCSVGTHTGIDAKAFKTKMVTWFFSALLIFAFVKGAGRLY